MVDRRESNAGTVAIVLSARMQRINIDVVEPAPNTRVTCSTGVARVNSRHVRRRRLLNRPRCKRRSLENRIVIAATMDQPTSAVTHRPTMVAVRNIVASTKPPARTIWATDKPSPVRTSIFFRRRH